MTLSNITYYSPAKWSQGYASKLEMLQTKGNAYDSDAEQYAKY